MHTAHCVQCVRQIHLMWWYDTVLSSSIRECMSLVRLNKLNWSGNTSFILDMAKIIPESMDKNCTDTTFVFCLNAVYSPSCFVLPLLLNSWDTWKCTLSVITKTENESFRVISSSVICREKHILKKILVLPSKKLWKTKMTEIISYFRVKFVN